MGVVSTIEEKCKRCYTCIRNCPAKAIKVKNEQAKVIEELCISCGTCFRVCNQNAKRIESGIEEVHRLLKGEFRVTAILAPSFVAAFPDCSPYQVVGALRKIGFDMVCEVAFGAELIACEYARIASSHPEGYITTPCPAIVSLVEIHYPELLPLLAPIVSPMIAIGRYLKKEKGEDLKIVFIGPCVAKKEEIKHPSVRGVVDVVLTFDEINKIFEERKIKPRQEKESDFDPPYAALGRSFPLHGGLLRTAALNSDILEKNILVVSGIEETMDLMESMSKGHVRGKFVDILFCKGCINGPIMEEVLGPIRKRDRVIDFVRQADLSRGLPVEEASKVNLKRGFINRKKKLPLPTEDEIRKILAQTNKFKPEDELNCGACGYHTCRDMAIAVYQGLAEPQMCLHYIISELEKSLDEIRKSHEELKKTQVQLIQSEKLASLGQLSAGIAHELNNPLGAILLYANMLEEELDEKDPRKEEIRTLVKEAQRCREIVKGLLDFARQTRIHLEDTDIESLLNEVISICKREIALQKKKIQIKLEVNSPKITWSVDPLQLRQALVNIALNGIEAITEEGTLTIKAGICNGKLRIDIEDTGCGIPEDNLPKIFDPFFTTKKMGKGTGLGLATTHGIVKMHKGEIHVQSKVGEGTKMTIIIPEMKTQEIEKIGKSYDEKNFADRR